MNPSTEDYAWLAKDAYVNERKSDVDGNPVTINNHKYKVFAYTANASGFHATAYKQVDPPHGIIISYRGTDPSHALTTVQDGAVDAIMVTGKVNPQIHDADRFTEQVLEKAKSQGISPASITVAGHSLGGTLAEVEAWRHHLHGQTFNAYGAAELGLNIPEGGSQVIDNVLAGDPVSAAGHQFGIVRVYATPEDIEQLREAGYLDGRHGFVPALQAMRLGDHSIDNFAPDPGKGFSVLTAENQARAKANAPAIGTFRHDVCGAREGIYLATQPGMPLVGLQATALGVEGLTTAGLATSNALQTAGHALEREVAQGAQVVAHGVHAATNGIEQAYATTRDHVAEGAQVAGHATRQLYDAAHHEVTRDIHATEQAAHTVAQQANQLYDATRERVLDGAHATEAAAHRAYDATRQGIAQSVDATERALTQGVHVGERATHRAYDATRQSLTDGVHTTEHALSQGVEAAERAAHEAANRAVHAFDTLTSPGQWFGGASATAPTRLDHPSHPDHTLYQQARSGVHRLDAEMHRAPDQRSDNLAAALTVEARRQGLTHIDEVALSGNGERAFAMQSGAHTQMAHVQTADAVQTSIVQSSAAWAQAAQQAAAVKAPPQEVQPSQQAPQAMGL